MRTSSRARARRLAPVVMAALGAVALGACGPSGSEHRQAQSAAASSAPSSPAASSQAAGSAAAEAGTATTSAPAMATATPAPTATAGRPGLAGFVATSVTFVSAEAAFVPRNHGMRARAVHGDRGDARPRREAGRSCPPPPCRSETRWRTRARRPLGHPVRRPELGFVFGNGLWVTTTAASGGRRSPARRLNRRPRGHRRAGARAELRLLGAVGLRAAGALYRRALSGGPWSPVTQVSGAGVIATQARVAAVLDGGA